MHCKSSHCECAERARAECDARLTAAHDCKNKFCKLGDRCPAKGSIDYMKSPKGTLDALLIEMNTHITEALGDNKAIDLCYDNARRRILLALEELPSPMTRAEQNRLLRRDTLLSQIEAEIAPCLNPHHSGRAEPGARLLHWLRTSGMLLGCRF